MSSGRRQSMTRWDTVFRRRGRGGNLPDGQDPDPDECVGQGLEDDTPVLVDQRDGLLLIRMSPAAAPGPEDLAEIAGSFASADDATRTSTVVVAVDGGVPAALWRRLGQTLD